MYNGLKRRKNFEELINDLQNFDSLVKFPNRKASILKEWIDMLTRNITDPSQISDEALKQILHDKAVQTSSIEVEHKATQTDLFEKGVQVDIEVLPFIYQKILGPYEGPDVVDHSGVFTWRKKNRVKATQVLRIPRSIDPLGKWEPPSTPSTPLSEGKRNKPISPNIPGIINPVLDAFFAPLNYGLGLLNQSPNISVHSSPAISVHSSPAISVHNSPVISVHDSPVISVHDSPVISVHDSPAISAHSSLPISVNSSSSSSTSRITSPPISVASSHHVLSPTSPSYLPVQEDANSPASSNARSASHSSSSRSANSVRKP